jgi:hypothetical protein
VIYICSALLFIYPYFLELECEFLTAVKVEKDFQVAATGFAGWWFNEAAKEISR